MTTTVFYESAGYTLSYFNRGLMTLQDAAQKNYVLYDSKGVGEIFQTFFYRQGLAAGTYKPENEEFAKTLSKYNDMKIKITAFEKIKIYPDTAVSILTPPVQVFEISFKIEWKRKNGCVREAWAKPTFMLFSQDEPFQAMV